MDGLAVSSLAWKAIKILDSLVDVMKQVDSENVRDLVDDVFDIFKDGDSDSFMAAMRIKSEKGYRVYCNLEKVRKREVGVPTKKAVLEYWASCVKRQVVPEQGDLSRAVGKEEAEHLFPCLMDKWLEEPQFTMWMGSVLPMLQGKENSAELLAIKDGLDQLLQTETKRREEDRALYREIRSPEENSPAIFQNSPFPQRDYPDRAEPGLCPAPRLPDVQTFSSLFSR